MRNGASFITVQPFNVDDVQAASEPISRENESMAKPTSLGMAALFSDLIGRHVNFSEQLNAIPQNGKQIYCAYLIKPMDSYRVVKADLSLLSSFAGALIGLSPEAIKERVAEARLDETLRDALHEVMNIASRIVTLEHRGVFSGMYEDPGQLPPEARSTVRYPCYSSYYKVTVDGYEGGAFSLLAPF